MVQLAVPIGSDPEEVVKDMELIHYKTAYYASSKMVHWGALARTSEDYDKIKQACIQASFVLALWEDSSKLVIAWIEEEEDGEKN